MVVVSEVHFAQLPPPPYNTSAMLRVVQAYGDDMTQLWLQAMVVPSGGCGLRAPRCEHGDEAP